MIRKGFTVVELLIVIVVIGILATLTIIAYAGVQDQARSATLLSDLEQNYKTFETYKLKNAETYPADTTAALGAGMKNSSSVNLTYYPNTTARSYCLEARSTINTNLVSSVSSTDATPAKVACIDNGMIGWWRLNGNATESIRGFATSVTTPLYTTGQNGQANNAGSFAASANNIFSASNFSEKMTGLSGMSLSTWVYAPNLPGSHMTYIGIRSGTEQFYILQLNGTNTLECRIGFASGPTYTVPGVTITPNVWRHVILVFERDTLRCYVGGSSTSSISTTASTLTATNNAFTIGGGNGFNLNGSLDDVRVYGRALSAAEVTNLVSAGAQ